ncbi:MAG TPA: glycosyltransferase family 39 protein [Candidatus Binataceae bacterium]|nr:glycosyltransferase family 39 protein [Candidatus Binataceae bacterium]
MNAAGGASQADSRADRRMTPADRRLIVVFALLTILIHFLTNGAYGYFRDELYFVACGQHLAWGYVDLPPMVAAIARLVRMTLGDSLFALRFFPALAGGATVAIAGILAYELGGGRFAEMLAMVAVMTAPVFLALDNILTINAFDPIFWMGCVWALIRTVKSENPRWWLVFGLSAGLGLENKESMLFLGAALLIGVMLTPQRRVLFNRWFLLGGLVALLIAMPTGVWQATHGFPMYVELHNVKASAKNAPLTWLGFLGAQILYFLPLSLPIWVSGLYFLFASEQGRRFRAIGWAYVLLYAAFVMLKGKAYYIVPIFPVLFAAGSVQLENVSRWGWRQSVRYGLPVAVLMGGLIAAPMAIPVLPVETFIKYEHLLGAKPVATETRRTADLPQNYADMFGWPEMVATVAKVYWNLPPSERSEAAIFASNYGEAAAIDFFGPRYGLPKAISGHMNYYLWGSRQYTGQVLIAITFREQQLHRVFDTVEKVAKVGTRYSMPDEHVDIFVCRDPKISIRRWWPLVRSYR